MHAILAVEKSSLEAFRFHASAKATSDPMIVTRMLTVQCSYKKEIEKYIDNLELQS